MKRFTLILLSILLLAAVMTVPVFAATDGGSAAVSSAAGKSGDTVILTVSLSGFENADTIGVKVICDADLTLDRTNSSWLLDGKLQDIDSKNNAVWAADSNPENVNKDVIKLAFKVPELTAGQTDLDYAVKCTVTVKKGSTVLGTAGATGKVTIHNPAETLRLDQSTMTLDLNGTKSKTITATVNPANTTDKITWTSRTPGVATVSEGTVTAVKAGTAEIVVTAGSLTKICTVTVTCSHKLTEHPAVAPKCNATGNNLYYTCDVCDQAFKADKKTVTTEAAEKLDTVACSGGTATCTQKAKCQWCGQEYGNTLPHSYQSAWEQNGTGHWHKCKDCDATTAPVGHTWGWVVDTAATDIAEGSRHEACTACKYKSGRTEVIPHTHRVTHHAAEAATCKQEGKVEYWTCASKLCGSGTVYYGNAACTKVLTTIVEPVNPNNHKETVVKNAVTPTCYQKGSTGDTYCKACDKLLTASKEIPATGNHVAGEQWYSDGNNHWHVCTTAGCGALVGKEAHAYQWKVDKPATEEATGLKHEACACGVKRSENTVIAKLEHKPVLVAGKAATCTEAGVAEHYLCSNCGRYYASDNGQLGEQITKDKTVLAAVGHIYGTEWISDAENHWHACACGETADKEAHKTETVNAKEATQTEAGYTGDTVCSVCQHVVEEGKEIPMLSVEDTTAPATEPATDDGAQEESGNGAILWIVVAAALVGGAAVVIPLAMKKRKG